MDYQPENIPQRIPLNNILPGHDIATKAQSMGLNQTRPEYQRHQMTHQSLPESERGGIGMFPGSMGPPNYMQYSAGGTYDDGRYSQYAVADYGIASESPFPQRQNGPINQPPINPNLLDGITSGRTPDTGSAIRQGMPNQEWISGDNRSGQSASHQAFEVIEAPASKSNVEPNHSTSYYACPTCNEIAIRVLDSPTRDAMCRNGHVWRLVNGKKIV